MKKSLFKSILAVSIAAVIAFGSFTGCSHNNNDDPNNGIDVYISSSPSNQPDNGTSDPITNSPEATDVVTEGPTQAPTAEPTEEATAVPTEKPSPVPATSVPSTPGNTVSIGSSSKPARFTMPTDLYGLSESACESWFSDAVFIGDSITIGWKNYNNKMLENDPNFFGHTRFLCEGSYGVGHAFDPISENSMHPVFAGEQHYIWDSVALMGANKVFLLFGLNDISIYGVDGTSDRFDELTDNIQAARPGVQIFIISTMYMYKGSEREKLNNKNIYRLNQRLASMCNRKGYEFVNIASHLIDENGFVPDKYSSDHYVHQTYAAYAVWAEILRSLAGRHIKGLDPIVFSLPQ